MFTFHSFLRNFLPSQVENQIKKVTRVFANPLQQIAANSLQFLFSDDASFASEPIIPQPYKPIARKIAYGRVLVHGDPVYAKTIQTTFRRFNDTIYMAYALAAHEIGGVEEVHLDKEVVDLDEEGFPISRDYYTWRSQCVFTGQYLSSATEPKPDWFVMRYNRHWQTNFRLTGISCFYVRYFYYEDILEKIPRLAVAVNGKLVQDWRDSSRVASSNPALCLYDFLTDEIKISPEEVDLPSFTRAANLCDARLSEGGKRYFCSAYFALNENPVRIIHDLLTTMAGMLVIHDGKWILYAGEELTSSHSLTEADLLAEAEVTVDANQQTKLNRVNAVYLDQSKVNKYIPAETQTNLPLRQADGITLETNLQFRFVNSKTLAERLMRIALLESRNSITVTILTKLTACFLPLWSCVDLSLAEQNWTKKKFRLVKKTILPNQTVELTLQEEQDQTWQV